MTNCRTGAVQKLGAELFFLVVAGEEDLTVLVEAVNETQQGVGGGSHQGLRIWQHGGKSSGRGDIHPSP